MTITEETAAAEAAMFDEAERGRSQMRQSTEVHPELTIDDAYTIQAAWKDLRLARGETMVGHKIGLTSRAMQAAMNITTPDSGFLTDAMVFEPNSELEAAAFCDPKLEIELAFVLAEDLSGLDLSVDDVLDATAHVSPSVELIAARSFRKDPSTGRTRTVVDTISDNAANAGIVCGGRSVAPREVDLRWVSALGYRNGIVEETGVAAGVLDHPAQGIVWLARRLAQYGQQIEAGQVILSGSFVRPVECPSGAEVLADFGDFGAVRIAFD